MIYAAGNDIWAYHRQGEYIAIPTNGFVKKNGRAVMGRGLAQDAATKHPDMPKVLGDHLRMIGNLPCIFEDYRLVSVPVKHAWFQDAHPALIAESCEYLEKYWPEGPNLYLPKLGCGNGKLRWPDVQPIMERTLLRRCFIAVV